MKRTFKEKAVFFAAKVTKKSKILYAIIFPILGVVVGIYDLAIYLVTNGKRFVTIGTVLLFFFMSTSFASPENMAENEVYLSSNGSFNIYDDDVSLVSKDDSQNLVDIDSEVQNLILEDIDSLEKEIYNEELDLSEAFTLSDFYNETCLHDGFGEENSSFDKDAWNLLLVNKTHPLPDNYEVPLATIKGSMKCDERVLDSLYDMLNSASENGINLIVCSPYREDKLQEKLFLRRINAYMSYNYSYLEAYKISSQDVIVPGTSEHQLGLAFDIVTDNHMVLDYEFGSTKGGKWLYENCADFGFILRYPKGKESITGIDYEPWHFRYVGKEAARYIMDNQITLEELWEDM